MEPLAFEHCEERKEDEVNGEGEPSSMEYRVADETAAFRPFAWEDEDEWLHTVTAVGAVALQPEAAEQQPQKFEFWSGQRYASWNSVPGLCLPLAAPEAVEEAVLSELSKEALLSPHMRRDSTRMSSVCPVRSDGVQVSPVWQSFLSEEDLDAYCNCARGTFQLALSLFEHASRQ